jgi:hypothetical protein
LGHHGPGNESHGNMEKYGKIWKNTGNCWLVDP